MGSIEEWLLVPGMTLELWNRLKSSVTVYGSGKVNLNTVSKETLMVLGVSNSLADRIIAYRKSVECASSAATCAPAFLDLGDLTQKIGVNSEDFSQLENLGQLWGFSPEIFRFVSQASDRNKQGVGAVECVIDKKGSILFLKEL